MESLAIGPIRLDVERARAFVLAHGGSRERARLEGILAGAAPDREVVKGLESLQNPDGGFPLWQQSGNGSSIDTTCYVLAQLRDMPPLAGSPMAQRAVAFLRRHQRPEGFWQEAVEGSPWAAGDDLLATTYLTANAVYTLLTFEPEHLDPIARGEAWLRRALGSPELARPYAQTLAMAACTRYRLAGPRAPEVAGWFDQLARLELGATELAWWISCTMETGVGGRLLVPVVRQLERLAGMQGQDGSWPAEEGYQTEATLMALRVFKGYGLI